MTIRPTLIPSDSTDGIHAILSTLWGFVPGKVLQAASEAGLFHAFEKAPANVLTLAEISSKTGWKPPCTRSVLSVLEHLNIVTFGNNSTVALTERGKRWFSPSSPGNFLLYFERWRSLERAYEHLPEVLRTGRPESAMFAETLASFGGDSTRTARFLQIMSAAAQVFSSDISFLLSQLLPPGKPLRFLDVGCGTATLSCNLQEFFPNSSFAAFDLPEVIPFATEFIAQSGKSGLVQAIASDWNEWPWTDKKYDVVLLSQIIHEMHEPQARMLVKLACSSLAAGGLLVVVMVGDGTSSPPDMLHSVFGINILVEVGGLNPDRDWLIANTAGTGVEETDWRSISAGRSVWVGSRVVDDLPE